MASFLPYTASSVFSRLRRPFSVPITVSYQQAVDLLPNSIYKLNVIPQEHENSIDTLASRVRSPTGLVLHPRRFDNQRKRRFLRIAKRFWPNVTRCCALAGISDSTFYSHFNQDKVFAHKIKEIDRGTTDEIEGVLASEARNPKSFLHTISYLRAHRPELYDRAKTIKIEGYKMSDKDRTQRTQMLENAIDAQVVQTYQDRRDKREAKIKANQEKQQALRPPE